MAALPVRTGRRTGEGPEKPHGPSSSGHDSLPPREVPDGPYELDFARCPGDVEAIQRLRFDVFNLELNEGLESSLTTGLDQDAFDAACDHLFVRHRESGRIVGTYRMQTKELADLGHGFYSASEFDLGGLPGDVLDASVEIGRACIHKDHRSLQVLYLLWKGIGRYTSFHRKRYLFGCCSLNSQDPDEGWSVYRQLESNAQLHADIRIHPHPSHACKPVDGAASAGQMPRLMKTYLSLGASICSEPAIDRAFKTIDYLAIFDFEKLVNSDLAFYRFR